MVQTESCPWMQWTSFLPTPKTLVEQQQNTSALFKTKQKFTQVGAYGRRLIGELARVRKLSLVFKQRSRTITAHRLDRETGTGTERESPWRPLHPSSKTVATEAFAVIPPAFSNTFTAKTEWHVPLFVTVKGQGCTLHVRIGDRIISLTWMRSILTGSESRRFISGYPCEHVLCEKNKSGFCLAFYDAVITGVILLRAGSWTPLMDAKPCSKYINAITEKWRADFLSPPNFIIRLPLVNEAKFATKKEFDYSL